jgi:hypothetical protein
VPATCAGFDSSSHAEQRGATHLRTLAFLTRAVCNIVDILHVHGVVIQVFEHLRSRLLTSLVLSQHTTPERLLRLTDLNNDSIIDLQASLQILPS